MKNKNIVPLMLILPITLITAFALSCSEGKKKEPPGMSIAGIKTTISRVLISPLAFDGAVVAIRGKAHEIKKEMESGEKEPAIVFKLSDRMGNFINVSTQTTWDIAENDELIVGGIYRRITNEIEAAQIEKIQLEKTE